MIEINPRMEISLNKRTRKEIVTSNELNVTKISLKSDHVMRNPKFCTY